MKDNNSRITFKRALEKSLELLGGPSKKLLLAYLEQDYDVSFKKDECPSVRNLEIALNAILGRAAQIIIDEFKRNLAMHEAKSPRKRPVAKHGRKSIKLHL